MNNDSVSKAYYLTIEEFLILLYKGEIQGLIFPNEITKASADGRGLKKAMSDLARDEIVVSDNTDGFRLSVVAKQWIDILQKSNETIILGNDAKTDFLTYIYMDLENVLCLQKDWHRENLVRMEVLLKKDLIERFKDTKSQIIIKRIRRYEEQPYEIVEEIDKI